MRYTLGGTEDLQRPHATRIAPHDLTHTQMQLSDGDACGEMKKRFEEHLDEKAKGGNPGKVRIVLE